MSTILYETFVTAKRIFDLGSFFTCDPATQLCSFVSGSNLSAGMPSPLESAKRVFVGLLRQLGLAFGLSPPLIFILGRGRSKPCAVLKQGEW